MNLFDLIEIVDQEKPDTHWKLDENWSFDKKEESFEIYYRSHIGGLRVEFQEDNLGRKTFQVYRIVNNKPIAKKRAIHEGNVALSHTDIGLEQLHSGLASKLKQIYGY